MVELVNHLFKTHLIQLAVFPEFASLLLGRKKALRIVYESDRGELDKSLFSRYGFQMTNSILWSRYLGNGFGDLLSSPSSLRDTDAYSKVNMVCISKSSKLLSQLEEAESCGETVKAGRILGYPDCCVERLFSVTSRGELWANYYLEDFRKSGFGSKYANRFPIVLGGMSAVGELFPCSLSCPHAIQYSKNMIADMESLGYSRVAEKCISDSSKTVRVDQMSGNISFFEGNSTFDIKFS